MSQTERDLHRKIAVECFNKTWDYLEKERRDADDDRQMLHLAHTSRYHWGLVGTARNLAVGDWQVSRAYAALKQSELALHFAKSALEICERNNLSDLLVSAYEGMARALALSSNISQARDYLSMARKQMGSITDKEDKKIFSDQIGETRELVAKCSRIKRKNRSK